MRRMQSRAHRRAHTAPHHRPRSHARYAAALPEVPRRTTLRTVRLYASPMSLIFATQLTAVGTAILAVFAVVAGVFGFLAFRKQAKEVSDQAEMLSVQSEQLAEDRKVNAEQIRVLALQAADLRESLAERKREAVERRNALASRVSIAVKPLNKDHIADGGEQGPRLEAIVVNASERQQPVYDAKLYWHRGPEGYGTPNPELLGTLLNRDRNVYRRDFPPGTDLAGSGAVLTFRDAAGVNWIRTEDGGLMHADSEIAPDLVKALFGTSRNGAQPLI